jgi:regulator of sigma E protease
MDLLFTIAAFLVALGILITVHELGHFSVARWLGVKVLRFSIGFGRPLISYRRHPEGTEYVLAALPLGGYVKMLDEREEEVPPDQLHLAFNRQAVWKRSVIVLAGPISNFLFAILAYWAVFMVGDSGLRPLVGAVAPGSIAYESGFRPGDEILNVAGREAPTWESAAFAFLMGAFGGEDIPVQVRASSGEEQDRLISQERLAELPQDPQVFDRLGLTPSRPELPAVIGELTPGEPAVESGLEVGDRILAANGASIANWRDWVEAVRKSPGKSIVVSVERAGLPLEIELRPRPTMVDGLEVGRIGAGAERRDDLMDRYRVDVRYGPLDALGQALTKTYDMSRLMLRVMGRMLVGRASVEHLSGPISIAETAGRTARYGLDYFIKFLAVVSVSLGVLNLLPVPVLDGGHLLYFFIEWVKGSPLSEQAQANGQKIGIGLILALMTVAFYVDLSRLFG